MIEEYDSMCSAPYCVCFCLCVCVCVCVRVRVCVCLLGHDKACVSVYVCMQTYAESTQACVYWMETK